MGTRPQMYLVFGVDDYDGVFNSSLIDEVDLSINVGVEYPHPNLTLRDNLYVYSDKRWKTPREALFYNRMVAKELRGVFGLIVDNIKYDSKVFRAMSVMDSKFEYSNKFDLPILPSDEYSIQYYKNQAKAFEDIEFQNSWYYSTTVELFWRWPRYAYTLRYVFNKLQFDMSKLDYKKYKAMLVWDWC